MRLSVPIGQRWTVLASAVLFVLVAQKAQLAWQANLIAVEGMHTVVSQSTSSPFYDVASCVVAARYGPSMPNPVRAPDSDSGHGLRRMPCPTLENPILSIRGTQTDYFRYLYGWTMLSQGQATEALSLWRSVDESDLFTMWLGASAYEVNDIELSLAYFELAQQINSRIDKRKQPMYSAQCRIHLWDKGQPADAVRSCGLAARFEKESQILLGRAYVESEKYAEAVGILSQFLLEQPKCSVALYWRARAYRELGDLNAAERDCQAAIAGDVLVPAAYTELAQVLVSLGEPCRARALLLAAEWSTNEELRTQARNSLRRLGQVVCD